MDGFVEWRTQKRACLLTEQCVHISDEHTQIKKEHLCVKQTMVNPTFSIKTFAQKFLSTLNNTVNEHRVY